MIVLFFSKVISRNVAKFKLFSRSCVVLGTSPNPLPCRNFSAVECTRQGAQAGGVRAADETLSNHRHSPTRTHNWTAVSLTG